MASSLKKDSPAHPSGFSSEISPNENVLSPDSLIPTGPQLVGYPSSHVTLHICLSISLSLSLSLSLSPSLSLSCS